MDLDVVSTLRCPLCREPLAAAAQALRCPRGHSFDIAKQGYVNLSTGRAPHSGDTPGMVAARVEFLAAGHYDFISAALDRAARSAYPGGGLIVDAGAGTGRHLAAVLDALPGTPGLALDVSKPALRRAARAHPRAGAALCDTWGRLPVADGAAGLVLNVFAPRNGAEFRRLLRPGGALLVVTPAADHLAELVDRLGLLQVDPDKADRVAASLGGHFVLAEEHHLRRDLTLTGGQARTLVAMGPSAWHTTPVTLDGPITVTASVHLGVYILP